MTVLALVLTRVSVLDIHFYSKNSNLAQSFFGTQLVMKSSLLNKETKK